jgi:hypothetical protein
MSRLDWQVTPAFASQQAPPPLQPVTRFGQQHLGGWPLGPITFLQALPLQQPGWPAAGQTAP